MPPVSGTVPESSTPYFIGASMPLGVVWVCVQVGNVNERISIPTNGVSTNAVVVNTDS